MYDESPKPPVLFANHVIVQFVEHMVGGDILVEPKDFMAIRLVFRRLGGSWEKLFHGDMPHLERLKKVVTTWAQMPNRRKKSDMVV